MKTTKRIAAVSLAAMMSGCLLGNTNTQSAFSESLAITANAATASGTCGTNLSWSLSGDTLTITGSGTTIPNYGTSSSFAPWKAYASQIKNVIFPKTLKIIGNAAFYKMPALEYVYTANGTPDGSKSPCFPDLTKIGMFAFSDCYNFHGNTLNGMLTFGTGAVSSTGTLTVGKQAFRNCDQVRFLKTNYKQLNAEEKAFHMMDHLTSLNMSDTTVQLGENVFLNSYALANVNYKPSCLPIHNTAFNGTSYQTNQCTDQNYCSRDYGAAGKLQGKTLIVNFFVDRTQVNLKWDEENCGFVEAFSDKKKMDSLQLTKDQIITSMPRHHESANSYVGIFNKNQMTCTYSYAWNPQLSSKTENAVRTLNNYDFLSEPDKEQIPLRTVQKSSTPGFFGSYVTSDEIETRLNDVRSAMNDLQAQAAEYGSDFTYEMHPETNFQITYDFFDWNVYDAKFEGRYLGYQVTAGYPGTDGGIERHDSFGDGSTYITDDPNDELHTAIRKATQYMTGDNAHPIDMRLNPGSTVSEYTNYLKSTYNVENVVYLIHVNAESQSFAQPTTRRDNPDEFNVVNRMDEFAVICSKTGSTSGSTLAEHEISHLFGTVDCYDRTNAISNEAKTYVHNYFKNGELMICNSTTVSPVTAFSLGWLDKLDTPTYQLFFG